MFKRSHHQRILGLLEAFNSDLLVDLECHFGGGTAIVLELGEYRESLDIDFICSSKDGFRALRNIVTSKDLGSILKREIPHLREVRSERDKISTFLGSADATVKVEFILEANIEISGSFNKNIGLSVLCREDMYATKLLANTDRGLDKSTYSRDIVDLAMMVRGWGPITHGVWQKAQRAYGDVVLKNFEKSVERIQDKSYLAACLEKMKMDASLVDEIPSLLAGELRVLKSKPDTSSPGNRK